MSFDTIDQFLSLLTRRKSNNFFHFCLPTDCLWHTVFPVIVRGSTFFMGKLSFLCKINFVVVVLIIYIC